MKTITELNNRTWYRLLKVIFVTAFVLASLVTISLVYDFNKNNGVDDYIITCNYGNKITFVAWSEERILLTDYDLRDYLDDIPSDKKAAILKACAISQEEIANFIDSIAQGTNNGKNLYDIAKVNVKIGKTLNVVFFSFLSLISVVIIFESLRRAFYYIILGNFRPQK